MDPDAGSSKMIENNRLSCSRKKLKFYHEERTPVSLPNINGLPDEMLIEIFSYLSNIERLRVQKVCSRWHSLAKNEVLWRCVNVSGSSPSFFLEMLASLPSCVSHLSMTFIGSETSVPLSLTEVMAKLQNQCPCLNTLFFNNFHLKKYTDCINKTSIFNDIILSRLTKSAKRILEYEFCKEHDIDCMRVVLSELKILSLRGNSFCRFDALSHVTLSSLPNLVVLDLSHAESLCWTTLDSEPIHTLVNLKELYLTGWRFPDNSTLSFLKHMKKLRVLDLEECSLDDITFSFIKENCVALEELYLATNDIQHIYRSEIDKDFFSKMQTLCLIDTDIRSEDIEKFLAQCPSLKHVDVSGCRLVPKSWYNGLSEDIKEVLFMGYKFPFSSDCHHFSTKYYNF